MAVAAALALAWCLVAFTPISLWLAQDLVRRDSPSEGDAVVVLASRLQQDGELTTVAMSRLLHGLELVAQGRAARLVLTELPPPEKAYVVQARQLAAALGVRIELHAVGPIERTRDEARAVAELFRSRGWRKALLVTSPSHSRRAAASFEKDGTFMNSERRVQRQADGGGHAEGGDCQTRRKPDRRAVRFEQLGLDPSAEYLVFEFWEERFLGRLKTGVELLLPPESSRIISVRRARERPQLIGTDMHLLEGVHEIRRLEWDAATKILSGVYHRMSGITGKAFLHLPEGWHPKFDFPLSPSSALFTHVEGPLWIQEIAFADADFAWTIPFEPPKPPPAREPTGPGTNP